MNLVDLGADDSRLAAFHAGSYWDAFAAQHEPLEVWRGALRGELPYELTVRVAVTDDRILDGIAFERYPRSGCGLVPRPDPAVRARRRYALTPGSASRLVARDHGEVTGRTGGLHTPVCSAGW